MAEQADLEERFVRIEAALAAASMALEAAELTAQDGADPAGALRDALAELAAARQRIETLEQDARARETTPEEAAAGGAAAEAGTSGAAGRVAELEAKVASLQAARAEDLTEMKALLAELEPLVEGAHA